jgi:hypothetical protein
MEEGLVKLAASLFCVAALSLVGCADVETTGGGQGDGIHPSKISLDDSKEPNVFAPGNETVLKQRLATSAADVICEGCVMDTYSVVDTSMGIDEVRIVSDGGTQLCKIFTDHGNIVIDECGWANP